MIEGFLKRLIKAMWYHEIKAEHSLLECMADTPKDTYYYALGNLKLATTRLNIACIECLAGRKKQGVIRKAHGY